VCEISVPGSRIAKAVGGGIMLVLCILFLASYWHVGVAGWDGVREGWQDAPGDWTVQPLTYTRSSSPTQVMAAGGNHACAITQRGTLCWGANWDGQLGTPQAGEVCFHHSGELPACSRSPQRVLSDRDFVWISAGGEHSCAIDTQGRAFCWGWNGYGQIGGPTDDGCVGPYQPTLSAPVNPCTYIPVQVTGHLTSQLRFAKIAAGGAHTCGVGVDGVAYCWGRNDSYQTGSTTSAATCDFDRPCNPDPVRVSGFYTVTAGTHHSCGIYSNGVAYCWGSNKDGQLGRGDIVMDRCGSGADEYWCSATPRLVMGGHRFATIDAADDHTCGVTVEGDAYCWGRNEYGELGDGLSFVGTVYYTPNLVVGGHRFVTIETGLSSTCGVTERGVTLCWGLAEYGEIGDGQTTPRNQSSPLPVDSSVRFHSVSSLGLFNCATDGTAVYCWGQNDFGQSGPTFQELCRGAFPCNVKPAFATGLGFGPPEIGALWIRGSKDPKHPMTTYDVELEAEIDMMPGYEISQVSWSGDLNPGLGNPYSYAPERATHGLKEIVATLTFTHTGSGGLGQVSREGEFKLFFEKDGDDNADGNPNWFDYWGVDGAVFGLDALDVKFDATITAELGKYNRVADTIFLGPKAAQPDPIAVEIEGPNCPRLTWGPYLLGIDRAAAVLAHERRHEAIYGYWDFTAADSCASPSGPWGGCRDSDRGVIQYWYDDRLPDAYELEVTGTSPEQVDSCGLGNLRGLEPVKYYGDQEYDARWHEQGHSGVPERDWANPGAQAEPVWLQGSDPVGRVASGSAVEGKSGGPTAGFVSAGQGTAVFPDLAELTGHYVDAGVDSDGDGLFDALRIEAGLTVTTPAVYEVVGWLQDDQGGKSPGPPTVSIWTQDCTRRNLIYPGRRSSSSGQTDRINWPA
jgi:alpha-tubulin suppressor-like RCC1 family protein